MAVKGPVETISCNVCGSDKYKAFHREGEWTIVKCKRCGHCFTNPRPTPDSLHLYYEEDYFQDKRHYNKFYNPDGSPKIENVSGVYNNRVSDVEGFVQQRGKLLDIGAARGAFIYKLKLRGWDVQGVEISQDAVEFGTKAYGVKIFCGIADSFQPSDKFDVITMYQTFEHIPNPVDVLKRCYDWLNPGGILVIEVPNRKGIEMLYSKHRRHLSYDLPRHLNHFSPQVLQTVIEKTGFDVVYKDFFYPKFIQRLIDRKTVSGKSNPAISAATVSSQQLSTNPPLARKPIGAKMELLRTVTNFLPGWRMTFIAQKPIAKS